MDFLEGYFGRLRRWQQAANALKIIHLRSLHRRDSAR
jgi:hypothetical protein